jgi:hypothetical protein
MEEEQAMKNKLFSGLSGLCRGLAMVTIIGLGVSLNAWAGHSSGEHAPKVDFVIPMNYELGMHCTGFEFAYCCVLPAYNSILAQVISTQDGNRDFANLLEGDPNVGLDFLGRETVLRDPRLDDDDNFKKYVLKYEHHAQPRNDGNGKPQSSTLVSDAELNSLLAWNTVYDAADTVNGKLVTGTYHGAKGVVLGDGDYTDANDNYQNGVWNHLYFYQDLEGTNTSGTSLEENKIRLGMPNTTTGFPVIYPVNSGPAFHPLGPAGSNGLNNVLTFSEDSGTVVFTQMKVLENLPVMLTSPRIWEALGLTLTPFEDTINFFGDPGAVDEDSIRPYVKMQATMHYFDAGEPDGAGDTVIDSFGHPVVAFGTAPIDIPNCERCHSAPAEDAQGNTNINSPNVDPVQEALVNQETAFWKAYYPGMQTGSDWYARLKGAAISILSIHDEEHGTSFTKAYVVPGFGTTPAYPGVTCTNGLGDCDGGPLTINPDNPGAANPLPQNTRLGNESVICQKCHADNVIAVVKSASCGPTSNPNNNPLGCAEDDVIPALTEAIHWNHRNVSEGGNIVFNDALGRDGGCQGCHPAHRSDGDMSGYPITLDGDNFYAAADNRDANGGCFVGRDVHSNPMKDIDGAETPSHLNPVGGWLYTNVAKDSGNWKGVWCTNCHSQAGQELWKAENVEDLIHAEPGDPGNVRQPVNGPVTEIAPDVFVSGGTLTDVVDAVNAATSATGSSANYSVALFESWLDPKNDPNDPMTFDPNDQTHAIWAPDPGLCNYVAGYFGVIPVDPAHDGNVATVEVNVTSAASCSTGGGTGLIDCGVEYPGAPAFHICGSTDGDGDFSVSLLDFCTTPDCVTAAQGPLPSGSVAVPVPMSAATDGRDHWLAPGEAHCADCHAAPYVEQSGNISAYPPFNYPRKASLMRYTRGHRDISCQGCHESIHGLYPVTPTIDTTSYAQAAQWNSDGSHGPLKCASCHETNNQGINERIDDLVYQGQEVKGNFDLAVGWMHTFTSEHDPRQDLCENCHGDNTDEVGCDEKRWLEHSRQGRVSRNVMDQVEDLELGAVCGSQSASVALDTVCQGCHSDRSKKVDCSKPKWKKHLVEGRVSQEVWESVSLAKAGSTCGW